MKTNTIILIIAFLVGLALLAGCKSDQTAATQGEGKVNGVVSDGATNTVLSGVNITAQAFGGGAQTKTTDAQGTYAFSFTIDTTTNVTLSLSKTGYRDTTIIVSVQSGTVLVLNIHMTAKSVVVPLGGSGSGLAQTIAFLYANPQEVAVYGVGGQETSVLGWQVQDSLGLPVDAAHAVSLTFTSTNGPNGGEYISPPVLMSNAEGQAFTTFNSGTRSGVVQITASATVAGRAIMSSPVRLVIRSGFADQAHFTVGPEKFNFPALGIFGKYLKISVLVGDKYSNPVASNTAIYFRSSAGVIQPTVFTDGNGQGSVNLISGNPAPLGAYAAVPPGDGYHYVVARTLGQGGVPVQDSILVLWSGPGHISNVNPSTFDIPNKGSQSFTFQVTDALGHPLAEGTKVTVIATIPPPPTQGVRQNQVIVAFGSNGAVEIPDAIFPGANVTNFSFTLRDGSWDVDDTDGTPVDVSIRVETPNNAGPVTAVVSGVVH
jgi:hypothetical protein